VKSEEKKKDIRKPYEKPLLRVINISDGIQTLGQGCKLAGSGSANYNLPTSCGISNYCSVNGS
jgi:hypothetical protein